LHRCLAQGQQQLTHVIAFSAGASAWWLASTELSQQLDSATLFYGSRIRDHLDIQSRCDTHFIFAEHENAYQPNIVVKELRQRGHQAEVALGCKHGFMNPYSAGFSLRMQTHYLDVLARKLHKQEMLAFGT
jgi:dienelactone hydrolase